MGQHQQCHDELQRKSTNVWRAFRGPFHMRARRRTIPRVLNRPGQVQYHTHTEHCYLSQPAQEGITSDGLFSVLWSVLHGFAQRYNGKAESKPAKLTRDPCAQAASAAFQRDGDVSRSTLSAHTAVELHNTTCTISTLILLKHVCTSRTELKWNR